MCLLLAPVVKPAASHPPNEGILRVNSKPRPSLSSPLAQLGACLDFLSDMLYFVPILWSCWRFGLHGRAWPALGVFCLLQVSVGA